MTHESEFDKYSEEYYDLLKKSTGATGTNLSYFIEYKTKDIAKLANKIASKNLNILDFGSGIGLSIPYMLKNFPNSKQICLDVSLNSLSMAKNHYNDNRTNFIVFDGSTIPFLDSSFDIVFATCVLHHIPPEQHTNIFNEVLRVLKPNGLIVIFEHNPYNPLTVHIVNTCPFDKNAILIKGPNLKSHLTKVGFKNTTLVYRLFFPHFIRILRPLEKYLTWLPLGAQYYVAGYKATF